MKKEIKLQLRDNKGNKLDDNLKRTETVHQQVMNRLDKFKRAVDWDYHQYNSLMVSRDKPMTKTDFAALRLQRGHW